MASAGRLEVMVMFLFASGELYVLRIVTVMLNGVAPSANSTGWSRVTDELDADTVCVKALTERGAVMSAKIIMICAIFIKKKS